MNLNSPNLNPYGNELLTFEKEINIRDQRTIYNLKCFGTKLFLREKSFALVILSILTV